MCIRDSVKTAEKGASDAEEAASRSEEVISEIRRSKSNEIADAQSEQIERVRERQLDAMKENNLSELDAAKDKANRTYDIEVDKINKMNILQKDRDSLLAREASLRDKRIGEAEIAEDKKVSDLDASIKSESLSEFDRKRADVDAKYRKKDEEITKRSLSQEAEDRLRKQNENNRTADRRTLDDLEMLDAELQANADQQDALKERMDKAGNAAGPSAAMVSGTQAAESATNRALSGSQSVEGTMKSQLKVLQEIHKDLQKQKQAKTVSL